jgi:transcriptional regulator with XRE-family HTH domain
LPATPAGGPATLVASTAEGDVEAWAGARFRALRVARGWSQRHVANQMRAFGYAWGQSTIGKIEAASRPVPLNEIADLAALFGVKLADLFAGAPERKAACSRCGDGPPAGFTCNECGRAGGSPKN